MNAQYLVFLTFISVQVFLCNNETRGMENFSRKLPAESNNAFEQAGPWVSGGVSRLRDGTSRVLAWGTRLDVFLWYFKQRDHYAHAIGSPLHLF